MTAMIVTRIPVAKAMVTTRPDVVRGLSLFMQVAGVAAELGKQMRPGAQELMAVTVGMQLCVCPAETKHIEVGFMVVTEHASVPVVIAAVVAVVVEEVVLEVVLSPVVEETVVLEAEVVLSEVVLLSTVVLGVVLEGAVVVSVFVLAEVSALVIFALVFAVVEPVSVVDCAAAASVLSALLLKSSFSSATSSLHSFANHIAPTAASDSSHPPPR